MLENILDLDVEPVQGFVCGDYLGWRVTTNRHAPQSDGPGRPCGRPCAGPRA